MLPLALLLLTAAASGSGVRSAGEAAPPALPLCNVTWPAGGQPQPALGQCTHVRTGQPNPINLTRCGASDYPELPQCASITLSGACMQNCSAPTILELPTALTLLREGIPKLIHYFGSAAANSTDPSVEGAMASFLIVQGPYGCECTSAMTLRGCVSSAATSIPSF
jgi:hypothetical protein